MKNQSNSFAIFSFALCLLPSHMATAEILRDPTRPPTMLSAPQNTTQNKEMEIANSGPRLQAVMISENHRSAIISGRSVSVGEQIGDARVSIINESEVVLRIGNVFKTLKLFPHSSKHMTVNNQRATR